LGIINNILIPLIAATAISPNCFYYALFSAEAVESNYEFSQCVSFSIDGDCMELRTFEPITSYQPPFLYSYQCIFKNYLIFYYYCLLICFTMKYIGSSAVANAYSSIYLIMTSMLIIGSSFSKLTNNLFHKILQPHSLEEWINVSLFFQSMFIVNIVTFLSIALSIGMVIPLMGIFICFCLCFYIHNTISNLGI
jgi:hypothetical protein